MANEALRLIGASPEAGGGSASEELNLRELWRALRRRKLLLLATIVVITGGAFAYVSQQTPLYTAEALIHIQNRDAKVVKIEGVVDQMVADPATIESEIQYLTSRAFARRNVEELNLVDDPEFNPALLKGKTEPSFLETINPLQYIPEEWLASIRGPQTANPDAVATKLDPAAVELNGVIDRFASSARGRPGRTLLRDLAVLHGREPDQGRRHRQQDGRRVPRHPARGEIQRRATGDRVALEADRRAARPSARGRSQDRRVPDQEQSGRRRRPEQPDHPAVLPAQHPAGAGSGPAGGVRGAPQPGQEPAQCPGRGVGGGAGPELAAHDQPQGPRPS